MRSFGIGEWSFFLLVMMLLSACSDDSVFRQLPDPRPIESAVKTAVPLARAAAMATVAINEAAVVDATPNSTCSVYPCSTFVDVRIVNGPFPIHVNNNGVAVITGRWNTADDAVVIASFVDINIGSLDFSVQQVAAFPVTRTLTGIRIVYTELDLNVAPVNPDLLTTQEYDAELASLNQTSPGSEELAMDMNVWVVDVDFNGTTTDFSDDIYTIFGGGQSFDIGGGQVRLVQLALLGLTVTSNCSLNPTGGFGLLQEIDTGNPVPIGQAFLTFPSACDGKAKISLGNGSFIGSTGRNLNLNF